MTREEVLKIVDGCFHCYASSYRSDAIEYANEKIDEIEAEQLKKSKFTKTAEDCIRENCNIEYSKTTGEEIVNSSLSAVCVALEEYVSQQAKERIHTVKDLEEAFDAGQEITNHEWHMEEFHGTKCKCEPPDYHDFKEYLKYKFMKENGLVDEDMINDIKYPAEI